MGYQDSLHTRDEVLTASREAAAWSHLRWNAFKPSTSLRTLTFAPDVFNSDHFHIVRLVMISRANELGKTHIEKVSSSAPLGRILVYEPTLGMYDCLAEGASDGFFDANDCPPWDLWVGFIRDAHTSYLLSWIPDYLVDVAQSGIDVTCGGSLYWLDQSDDPWTTAFYQT
ncbi:MAG: hypothetical protein NVS3B3_20300 [Aquirhabdus sp.]